MCKVLEASADASKSPHTLKSTAQPFHFASQDWDVDFPTKFGFQWHFARASPIHSNYVQPIALDHWLSQ